MILYLILCLCSLHYIVPTEMNNILKETFNRWYSVKSYYLSITIIDFPISVVCCFLFSVIIYFMSGQPLEMNRFVMFFLISTLVVLVAQSIGLIIGSCFNVVVSIITQYNLLEIPNLSTVSVESFFKNVNVFLSKARKDENKSTFFYSCGKDLKIFTKNNVTWNQNAC